MPRWPRSLAAAALVCGACAWSRVPEPEPGACAVAISVDVHLPLGLESAAQVVYFARVDGGQGVERDTLLASSVTRDGRLYLLNAPPGEYVAVAAEWTET